MVLAAAMPLHGPSLFVDSHHTISFPRLFSPELPFLLVCGCLNIAPTFPNHTYHLVVNSLLIQFLSKPQVSVPFVSCYEID